MEHNYDFLLETRDLSKVYSRKQTTSVRALDRVNLKVRAGEFLTLIGRSGSGKTTLLNLIGTLDRPTSGSVIFEGKNLGEFSNLELAHLRKRKIGFIFQTFNLLATLTVFENVELALIHSALSTEERSKKVESLLLRLGVADESSRLPLELSVGQQQKVAIARSLVNDPILILADEPTGEMDPITGKEIFEKLAELNSISKVTIIVATHGTFPYDQGRKTLFISNGRIVSKGEAGY